MSNVIRDNYQEYYEMSKAVCSSNSNLDKSNLMGAGFTPLLIWQDVVGRYLEEVKL